jgi:hypothetical protein
MARLANVHQTAYLTTQTTRYRAVNLYLNFSFVPFISTDKAAEGWELIEDVLRRRIV